MTKTPPENNENQVEAPRDKNSDAGERKSRNESVSDLQENTEQKTKKDRELMKLRKDGLPTGTMHDFGTPEIPGAIKGRPPKGSKEEAQAHRQEARNKNYHRDVAAHLKESVKEAYDDLSKALTEKPTPHDGQTITLKDLLSKYKTPFIDAYDRSKALSEEQEGKSPTLEKVVDRLKDSPWADQIRIKFDSRANNPDYDNFKSTITIRPQDSAERQIQNFSHEGFHATHQFLSKLYDGGQPIGQKEFVDVWMQGEVDAMHTESKVQQELQQRNKPATFVFLSDKTGSQGQSINIGEYISNNGKQAFEHLLRTAQPTGTNAKPYGEHYSGWYQKYYDNYHQNKPAVDKYIQQWVKSGRARSEI